MVRTLPAIAYSQPIFFTLKFIAITSKGRRSVQRTVDLDRSIDPGGGGLLWDKKDRDDHRKS